MDNETILKKLRDILEEATELSYIKKVFVGNREEIYGDLYPCIMLETPADRMSSVIEGNVQENAFVIQIYPCLLTRDREKALIGDTTEKGIMDVINDIKTVIYSNYPTLQRTCLYFHISVPNISDFPDMAGTFALMEMTCVYRESI
jgi:hypothetical protein